MHLKDETQLSIYTLIVGILETLYTFYLCTMRKKILLVEDEEHLQDIIRFNLEMEGYKVDCVKNGIKAVEEFKAKHFDLVILDVMLPGIDGFSVCRTIRMEDTKVPVLFLTAKNSSQDRVQGLKIGGDDYLSKPFNLEEFLLRVQKLLQRGEHSTSNSLTEYRFGGNSVNFVTFEINGLQGKMQLSKREIMLLKLLIERKNEVVSRKEILNTIWGYDVYPSTRTIDNYILAFRKYFEKDTKNPNYFFSIRGVGYKFSN